MFPISLLFVRPKALPLCPVCVCAQCVSVRPLEEPCCCRLLKLFGLSVYRNKKWMVMIWFRGLFGSHRHPGNVDVSGRSRIEKAMLYWHVLWMPSDWLGGFKQRGFPDSTHALWKGIHLLGGRLKWDDSWWEWKEDLEMGPPVVYLTVR